MLILAAKEPVADVVSLLKRASDSYYNTGDLLVLGAKDAILVRNITGRSASIITDTVFDRLWDWLKEKDPNNPQLRKVGSPVKEDITLPVPMGSLDKIRPTTGALDSWMRRNVGPYIVSDKEDGVSILLDYTYGTLRCYTRGDGVTGQNITHLSALLNVPQKSSKSMMLRGEIIMSRSKFKGWSGEYKNARNMVSGLVNRKTIHEALKSVDVVVYEVLSPRGVPSVQLSALNESGFTTVPYRVYDSFSEDTLTALFKKRKASSKYEIDGLVVAVDRKTPLPTGGNPKTAFAFKTPDQGDVKDVKVVGVRWEVSKNGLIKPTVEIEPTEMDGVTVRFATAHNGAFIYNNNIGPGTILQLIRSGGVIPKIEKVIKSTKMQMPKGIPYEWNDSDVDIYTTVENHADQVTKRIASFFVCIGVDNLGLGTIVRLYDAGFDTIDKILRMKVKDFLKIDGIQDKTAQKLYSNIKDATDGAYLPSVADGSGMFGANFGTRRIAAILQEYPDFHSLSRLSIPIITQRVSAIHGFSENTASQFAKALKPFMSWVDKQPITFDEPEPLKVKSSKLLDVHVCFTGFRDQVLENDILSNGGEVWTAVKKGLTVLLVKDLNTTSSKAVAARDLGATLMTTKQFRSKFHV